MHPFALLRADDAAKSIAAHAQDAQLAFNAGGTDLIGLMKDRATLPSRLLDINGLPDMAQIEALPDGGLRIGALARMSDVAAARKYASAFSSSPRRCYSPRPANSATWRQWAATSRSANPASTTSPTIPSTITTSRRTSLNPQVFKY